MFYKNEIFRFNIWVLLDYPNLNLTSKFQEYLRMDVVSNLNGVLIFPKLCENQQTRNKNHYWKKCIKA